MVLAFQRGGGAMGEGRREYKYRKFLNYGIPTSLREDNLHNTASILYTMFTKLMIYIDIPRFERDLNILKKVFLSQKSKCVIVVKTLCTIFQLIMVRTR
jgi:hypothetical protein